MENVEVRKRAEAFAALPKAERKTAFAELPDAVKPLARELVTSKYRGFRHVNGRIEMGQELLASEIARLTAKEAELEVRKEKVGNRIAELREEWTSRGFTGTPEEYNVAKAEENSDADAVA